MSLKYQAITVNSSRDYTDATTDVNTRYFDDTGEREIIVHNSDADGSYLTLTFDNQGYFPAASLQAIFDHLKAEGTVS